MIKYSHPIRGATSEEVHRPSKGNYMNITQKKQLIDPTLGFVLLRAAKQIAQRRKDTTASHSFCDEGFKVTRLYHKIGLIFTFEVAADGWIDTRETYDHFVVSADINYLPAGDLGIKRRGFALEQCDAYVAAVTHRANRLRGMRLPRLEYRSCAFCSKGAPMVWVSSTQSWECEFHGWVPDDCVEMRMRAPFSS